MCHVTLFFYSGKRVEHKNGTRRITHQQNVIIWQLLSTHIIIEVVVLHICDRRLGVMSVCRGPFYVLGIYRIFYFLSVSRTCHDYFTERMQVGFRQRSVGDRQSAAFLLNDKCEPKMRLMRTRRGEEYPQLFSHTNVKELIIQNCCARLQGRTNRSYISRFL